MAKKRMSKFVDVGDQSLDKRSKAGAGSRTPRVRPEDNRKARRRTK